MQIKKVFNNNVVLAKNEWDQEMVVMGRGLAFQKKAGETIDTAKIEKTFVLEKRGVSDKLAKLLRDTSELYLNIASKILDYAKSQLPYKLDDYLYVALTDHISFAIKRHKENVHVKNPLVWEIRKYYKQEYQVALKCLDIIEEQTGVRFPEDEAASIALHLVNSELSGGNLATAVQVTELVNNVLNIVKYHFKMELDETSINYERFLTHLRFFAIRFIRKERMADSEDNFLYEQLKSKYPESFQCSQKIKIYLVKSYNWSISKDEEMYLTLHIQRVTKRHLQDQAD
ncbi:transcription antiterminator BglG [Shouchella clausii]|jgi:beta-glucoside operon transcriptional antiterminator|uniref:BglG family transcription antiterminator LicT n=1 Tax=Shouchella TaxID=2893057 RepID=UPI000917208F|nr:MULTISPECIES: PRD domain-containing protein [Shouchella]MCM3547691.1 PRD domain-containing protein [Shouchella clausii]MDO7285393.1 PRD domain-containing protein [Shouchella clausii]MDO7301741.1 PRD domain-containing protein [Shouchella clausii]SHL50527.1 transcriptional antiterminator, BglG family [Shouchella rhizosphaerae]GIN06876.1 transcription antiterminator BglG [Shouchella clausii]